MAYSRHKLYPLSAEMNRVSNGAALQEPQKLVTQIRRAEAQPFAKVLPIGGSDQNTELTNNAHRCDPWLDIEP